jgi:dTDP-4-amino-4,6-dideoxygalactose transaminase
MNVPLLDLTAQYKSLKQELDSALIRVAESQHFILGPEVESMEKDFSEYLNVKYAYGVSSGTDALLLALMALGVKPGDEVISPTYSFFATAGTVSRINATPVFVESDPLTFNIDPEDLRRKITNKTKVIIPVHLFGQSADMDAVMEIAKEHGIKVVEDGAQAIGVQYKDGRFLGSIGDIGCFSFFPSKNLGCFGDGGLVTTNDDKLAENLQIMRVHGGKPKYYHKVIGGNFRLDALQAAVLKVKLPHLDSWSEGRRKNAKLYNRLFKEAGLAEEPGKIKYDEKNKVLLPKAVYEDSGVKNFHIYNQYCIRIEKRDELRDFLAKNGVITEIYYPVPFHKQECFTDLGHKEGDFPIAEELADTSLALPIYPELKEEQIKYVVDTIKKFF